jgi:hypothetical protein
VTPQKARAKRAGLDQVGEEWSPGHRVNMRIDTQLLARLDRYCDHANRSRSAAARHLIAVSLRHFEEEVLNHVEAPRSRRS